MKKAMILAGLCFIFSQQAFSQAQNAKITYQKVSRDAVVMTFTYPSEIVEEGIKQQFEKLGMKGSQGKGGLLGLSKDGFITYKDAVIADISSDTYNYTLHVESKSRKEKDNSYAYLIISKNDNSFLSPDTDPTIYERARNFMATLLPGVEAYNLEVEIKKQEEVLGKAEKKLRNLEDDQKSLEKRIKGLQDDLEKNKKDQQSQTDEVSKQKILLESLKGKRKL